MIREDLSHYYDLSVRLHTLQTEIVGDTAKDYSSGFPHSIMLRGVACDDKTQQEVKLLHEKLNALDSIIDSVKDVRAKNLLDMHYRRNMTWWQIAKRTGRSFTAEKQYLYNFLKKA